MFSRFEGAPLNICQINIWRESPPTAGLWTLRSKFKGQDCAIYPSLPVARVIEKFSGLSLFCLFSVSPNQMYWNVLYRYWNFCLNSYAVVHNASFVINICSRRSGHQFSESTAWHNHGVLALDWRFAALLQSSGLIQRWVGQLLCAVFIPERIGYQRQAG